MMERDVLTSPYAVLLSCSSVISATYANITENVTEKSPDTDIRAKNHLMKRDRNTQTSLHALNHVESINERISSLQN